MTLPRYLFLWAAILGILGSAWTELRPAGWFSSLPGALQADQAPIYLGLDQSSPPVAGGVRIDGGLVMLPGTPGLVYVHRMRITDGPDSGEMDIRISAVGLAQYPDSGLIPLPTSLDQGPYSARSFITDISASSFHLSPGASMPVTVTIRVPGDFQADSAYGGILVECLPSDMGNSSTGASVGIITNYVVPVVVQTDRGHFRHSAVIQNINVGPIVAGVPIPVSMDVKNTGNHHFRFYGRLIFYTPSGQAAADVQIPLTGVSLLPTFMRTVTVTVPALPQVQAGIYTIYIEIYDEDGKLLATNRPLPTLTPTATAMHTPTPMLTETATPTPTETQTGTLTPTPTITMTHTPTRTVTLTQTKTLTATHTSTSTLTQNATSTHTQSPTATPTQPSGSSQATATSTISYSSSTTGTPSSTAVTSTSAAVTTDASTPLVTKMIPISGEETGTPIAPGVGNQEPPRDKGIVQRILGGSIGRIAGLVVIGLAMIALVVFMLLRRRRGEKEHTSPAYQ